MSVGEYGPVDLADEKQHLGEMVVIIIDRKDWQLHPYRHFQSPTSFSTRIASIAASPPCRWSAPVESMTIPSRGSAATIGAKRCNVQNASRSSASASATGSASWITKPCTSA